jgi:hypothetical protein
MQNKPLKLINMIQFETDLKVPMNGAQSKGIYNLLVTKRDVNLYCVGIIPHKNFKISDVKKYFGLKGNKIAIKTEINDLANRALLGEFNLKDL